MPIYRLFKDGGFTPEHCNNMGEAFEQALTKLRLRDRSDPLVELVAKTIIELGQQGESDIDRLRDRAVAILSERNDGAA